jgi:hypothetical protein
VNTTPTRPSARWLIAALLIGAGGGLIVGSAISLLYGSSRASDLQGTAGMICGLTGILVRISLLGTTRKR